MMEGLIENPMLETFAILAAAVALLGIVLFLVKRYVAKVNNGTGVEQIKVISKVNLMPKNQIFIIEVNNKKLLIGVSEKNINLLKDLSENETPHNPIDLSKLNPKQKELLKKRMIEAKKERLQSYKTEAEPDLSFSAFLKDKFFSKS